ncbi:MULTISPECIES: VF530 family DNA-binding protein [Oceanospirillales]|uniref:VF530 family protein n=1 Tax=Oceanospirillum linum TaxID=966 RepID=UPI00089EC1A1|nr:Uncharacterized conserved protein [Oleiphilus messinensis]SMP29936.1 Uncharacterized conserved protein [Oceanospirillum linum]
MVEKEIPAVKKQVATSQDPLHGVKLEQILNELVAEYGWPGLHQRIAVNCFKSEPSIRSSLKFLRKTPWARQKVESLYLKMKGFSTDKRATKTEAQLVAEVKKSLDKNKAQSSDVALKSKDPWLKAKGTLGLRKD